MNEIMILKKNQYSDRYSSVDELFSGDYTIDRLMDLFPNHFFVIVNDNNDHGSPLIITEKKVKEVFDIDKKGMVLCTNCNVKNRISSKHCRGCGYENKYWEVLKYFDPEFKKSVMIQGIIDDIWMSRDAR